MVIRGTGYFGPRKTPGEAMARHRIGLAVQQIGTIAASGFWKLPQGILDAHCRP
jgi:hypothetical protein